MVSIQISYGELADRVSIIAVKLAHILDTDKREELTRQADALVPLLTKALDCGGTHYRALLGVNTQLWDIEDALRRCESLGRFDASFIHFARQVYTLNDKRYAIKRQIDEITGCDMYEVKELPKYDS